MQISKILSANDTGENKSHQAGILIPKDPKILRFFPELGISEKNPRVTLNFTDDSHKEWDFNFIYYNNKFYGGTRNEYRLTGMTKYIKSNGLKSDDEVILRKTNSGQMFIGCKQQETLSFMVAETASVLKLGNKWKVISL